MFDTFKPLRPAHNNYTDCQLAYYVCSKTVGEVTGWLVSNYADQYESLALREAVTRMVDEYFVASPHGTVTIGNYTPRGRKRHGLRTRQRRLFCVKLGTQRHYFPGVVYRVGDVTVQADRVTVRCRCKGVTRPTVPLTTVLWSKAS